MERQKLKILFIVLAAGYFFCGLFGAFGYYSYVDENSYDRSIARYQWIIILTSIGFGAVLFIGYKKLFPKIFSQQRPRGKYFLLGISILLSYALNRGYVKLLNAASDQESITIQGEIQDKYYEGYRKRRHYFLKVLDQKTNQMYLLRVPKNVYNRIDDSEKYFSREFKSGMLGIIYRKEF